MQNNNNREGSIRYVVFGICVIALLTIFALPLAALYRYAISRELYSHMLLVPFISAYLILQTRREMEHIALTPSRLAAAAFAIPGAVALLFYIGLSQSGYALALNDALFLTMFSLVSFILAALLFCCGRKAFSVIAFPLLFLFFLVPFPVLVEGAAEDFFMVASGYCYAGLLTITRTPYIRDGMLFQLPGLSIEVARECSGIRSSLVLCITGLLAGHMFLRTGWRKTIAAFLFIPIGILRNGMRILTITLGSVHIDLAIMESPLHHRGGTAFFVLSLVPLMLIMWLLRRSEMKSSPTR